jgi:diguanylate cyclase
MINPFNKTSTNDEFNVFLAGLTPDQISYFLKNTGALLTEYKNAHQNSIHDTLTGLHNRRFYQDKIKEEVERAYRYGIKDESKLVMPRDLSLVLLDIDKFKSINDEYGHEGGDEILRNLGRILKNKTRYSDSKAHTARLGGEEFALILPETDLEHAYSIAERLRKIVSEKPFEYKGDHIPVTISLGVSQFNPEFDGDNRNFDLEEQASILFRNSDAALYEAKIKGRNRTIRHK